MSNAPTSLRREFRAIVGILVATLLVSLAIARGCASDRAAAGAVPGEGRGTGPLPTSKARG